MKLFEEYPCLTDGRVMLKKMTAADAAALERITSKASVYATVPTFLYELKYQDKAEVIARMDEEIFDTHQSILLGVYLCDDPGRLIGLAEIYNYEGDRGNVSIGCRLDDDYWGKGVAQACTVMLIDYLFRDIGLDSITAHVLAINTRSEGVLLSAGFIKETIGFPEDWGFDEMQKTDKFTLYRNRDESQPIKVEQFVMAYGIEQDRIRALLPDGFRSLRPVLRINTEIRDGNELYVEFNTPVEARGKRGWLNIANWNSRADKIYFSKSKSVDDNGNKRRTVRIRSDFLTLEYTGVGLAGGCPAEKDNDGCFFRSEAGYDIFMPAEIIEENKEFCDCSFAWHFGEDDAHGRSQGKTIPAFEAPVETQYERKALTAESASAIPCKEVLGAYIVRFRRQ